MEGKQQEILSVEGMTCTNCAIGVQKIIEKNGGENAKVNFSTGEAIFDSNSKNNKQSIIEAINKGGYKVLQDTNQNEPPKYSTVEKLFAFCALFTIPLFTHMFVGHDSFINNPILQICLTIPVLLTGGTFFIKSGFNSLKIGIPNMDVLVSIGILSAFIYSCWGVYAHWGLPTIHDYLFFETTATVTTLVLLGNVIEHRSVKQTTSAISDLQKLQVEKVKVISNGILVEKNISEVMVGDLIQINEGDAFPIDGIVVAGHFEADESMLSGESEPIYKQIGDKILGGTLAINGNGQIKATSIKGKSTLDEIILLVKNAQDSKPDIQKLGDRISAIFVPIVLGASLLTFIISYFFIDLTLQASLMHSIAVLVISCPCAMGLAAPTAVMVGVGKAAKNGILIKGGQSLEKIAKTKIVVFDKTGTLTTGNFSIEKISFYNNTNEKEAKAIIRDLCSNSSHPISKSLFTVLSKDVTSSENKITEVDEIKGVGLKGKDSKLNNYELVSFKNYNSRKNLLIENELTNMNEDTDLVLIQNEKTIASLIITDEIKEGVKSTISWLTSKGIQPIMLSGDKEKKCVFVARQLGITEFYFEKNPNEKLALIDLFNKRDKTAMIGDGINDAPALAKAHVGISFGVATGAAINSSEIVLLNTKFETLIQVFTIGKQTYKTIKQNFFWAFAYNTIAIPIAAAGYLKPILAALSMAFSDVIVIGNSILLRFKKNS